MAGLILVAIIWQFSAGLSRGNFNIVNFFSFFTIESNILACLVLVVSSMKLLKGKETYTLEVFRGGATLYMVMTGIIYFFLLSGLEESLQTPIPFVNVVLHYVGPIVMAFDWLIDSGRFKIAFTTGLSWLVFPLVYVGYSLFRGIVVNWYPYPFLNPTDDGYFQVLMVSLIILPFIVALVYLITLSTKYQRPYHRTAK